MIGFDEAALKDFLERKYAQYSNAAFISEDPVSIPHRFTLKEDREIAGFFAATISWGQRKTILQNASRLLEWMDDSPFEFVTGFTENDLKPFRKFVHRTFQGTDCIVYLRSLKRIYADGGLQVMFEKPYRQTGSMQQAITLARRKFFASYKGRTLKHFSDPSAGSAAKRMNMFLRWMVRKDDTGIDFGMWDGIGISSLVCPLDVHSGKIARKLGLLLRKQNDWKAAEELTQNLRLLDNSDPVKYDLALFSLGAIEKF